MIAFEDFTNADLITLLIAAWGAVLSTALGIRQITRDRKRVRVIVTPIIDASTPELAYVWGVRAVNVRERPVEIQQVWLRLPTGSLVGKPHKFGDTDPQRLPRLIGDGESVEQAFNVDGTHTPGSVIGGFALDSSGHVYSARHPPRGPRALWKKWKLRYQSARARRRLGVPEQN